MSRLRLPVMALAFLGMGIALAGIFIEMALR